MKILVTTAAILLLSLPMLALGGQVDINTADAETISAELNGIGLSKAKAIVEYRKKHGPFRSPEDLSLVKGIGERTVEKNLADIKVSTPKK
ncbi:MAG: helix-hairpin-helix domain-containing protein [Gammaproteobacteria bacterium]|jgi:competence protein ComEA|nr:helix-hairpin-helix domain-containing protein [Gammaproteobacteria bacterium]